MIAYDTNVLIYTLEGSGPWAGAAQALVQKGEQEGAVLSILAWQELMTGAALQDDTAVNKVALALGDLQATKFVPVTRAICERAVDLTKRYGRRLYGYDAIHLATAMEYKAEAFVTNDKVLLSLQPEGLPVLGLS